MFVDTHCHISKDDASIYIRNAKALNVKIMISASEDLKSSLDNVLLVNKEDDLYACVGVHPLNVVEFDFDTFDTFKNLLSEKKVVAIGEIGLDYHYSKDTKDLQIKVFRMFLKLAEEYKLPVVIHSRDATLDTINILKEYNVKGIIHCFSGSLEVAREYIKMGFLIGIGGVLTFKNSKLHEIVREIPLKHIVLETDAPFMTPEPYRKYKNESKYIPVIASCLAKYKDVSIDEVQDITTKNALEIFGIF